MTTLTAVLRSAFTTAQEHGLDARLSRDGDVLELRTIADQPPIATIPLDELARDPIGAVKRVAAAEVQRAAEVLRG